ncbi:hypothetical protein CDD83_7871 [Cordyceps sp. RAO-2017]|nr:hypothetical protein CDD83_7871 [Cordyceps sp. RAO-2017]
MSAHTVPYSSPQQSAAPLHARSPRHAALLSISIDASWAAAAAAPVSALALARQRRISPGPPFFFCCLADAGMKRSGSLWPTGELPTTILSLSLFVTLSPSADPPADVMPSHHLHSPCGKTDNTYILLPTLQVLQVCIIQPVHTTASLICHRPSSVRACNLPPSPLCETGAKKTRGHDAARRPPAALARCKPLLLRPRKKVCRETLASTFVDLRR